MSELLGITVKKAENPVEWYQQLILKGGFADYSPVKGCIVIRPWGYAIWEEIMKNFDKILKERGYKNAYFPLFIPESLLRKEAEHFEGFTPEVAWVTHAGEKPLEEKLAVRPTSETIMYAMFARWIQSYRDLPLRINQWCNVVRWETKMTKPFIRGREFLWHEGHSAHATETEAREEVFWEIEAYRRFMEDFLAMPVIAGFKTPLEKFAGAVFTLTLEAFMPDGKAIQVATAHMLGQNFSKAYEVKFLDKDEKWKYVWQTSFGISTRLIGAMLLLHGDDKGAIIPPKVAPLQVVIVPIPYKGKEEAVREAALDVEKRLKALGLRAMADLRPEYTPGWKYNEWELKGVPLRIEIGPRDLEKKQITVAKRTTGEKIPVGFEELEEKIPMLLEQIQKELYERARSFLEASVVKCGNLAEVEAAIARGKMAEVELCSSDECEEEIAEKFSISARVIPFEKKPQGRCVVCGKRATRVVIFSRAY